ncbi:hypothetical protein [Singulisphaera sp. PoT]|uniref:hypothetical protein n=1 Tax=Singulisphaera sp. PoT TaxID=3411797 RepID=UPI003BF4C16E
MSILLASSPARHRLPNGRIAEPSTHDVLYSLPPADARRVTLARLRAMNAFEVKHPGIEDEYIEHAGEVAAKAELEKVIAERKANPRRTPAVAAHTTAAHAVATPARRAYARPPVLPTRRSERPARPFGEGIFDKRAKHSVADEQWWRENSPTNAYDYVVLERTRTLSMWETWPSSKIDPELGW